MRSICGELELLTPTQMLIYRLLYKKVYKSFEVA